jgi:hypothetical protein
VVVLCCQMTDTDKRNERVMEERGTHHDQDNASLGACETWEVVAA